MNRQEFDIVADQYERATQHHSLAGPMVRTPPFAQLRQAGSAIVPFIIQDFRTRKRWGMNWYLVLSVLCECEPYRPEIDGAFAKYDVKSACQAWIDWYDRRSHDDIPTEEIKP